MRIMAWFLLACGCAGTGAGGDSIQTILTLPGDAVNGEAVYGSTCAVCHGDAGEGDSGPPLQTQIDDTTMAQAIWNGTGDMSGYDGVLTEQEVADVMVFIQATFFGTGA